MKYKKAKNGDRQIFLYPRPDGGPADAKEELVEGGDASTMYYAGLAVGILFVGGGAATYVGTRK